MKGKGKSGAKPAERADTKAVRLPEPRTRAYASVIEEAVRAGLFDGEKTQLVSFRAPSALVEAAKRETGLTSTSELVLLGLARLASPDPVAAFFRRTEGRLGPDHDLVY